jgi:hypothetical protein
MIKKCINLKIIDFRQAINQLINSTDLDAGIVYYIIKDIFQEVERQYNEIIQEEYSRWME